jgi:hypothetical protein
VDRRDNVLSNHLVVKNGHVIGGWRRTLEKSTVTIEARLLATLDAADARELRAAAERYGRFLGLEVKLTSRPAKSRGTVRRRAKSA